MNITFDVYGNFPSIEKYFDKDITATFREIRLFVEERLGVLKDKIEAEEALRPCLITINLMSTGFDYTGYSQELIDKMDNCFGEHDMEYLSKRVERAIKD